MANGAGRKTCFVVMGFGQKTDFQSNPQRVLDLNRTYEDIIKPAVEAAGVDCIRADEIIHSTVIDKPMYEQLLNADIVIADLSTSNANALYELGVRHALRPHTTIIIAEQQFTPAFDINHVLILKYEHLGKEIGFREVMRMREELTKRVKTLVEKQDVDSPVFMFLPSLRPGGGAPAPEAPPKDDKSLADLMESLKAAKRDVKNPEDWLVVVAVLNRLRKLQPDDAYIVQQLALATYKSKQPNASAALEKARSILEPLLPDTSSDAETVGLWGAIHKRLWEAGREPRHLDTAVRAYARGYFIKDDYYNGINFAFLLNVRATTLEGDEAIADRVLARRIRREVLALCDAAKQAGTLKEDAIFWVEATRVEALLGVGRVDESKALRGELIAANPPPASWMIDTMDDQLKALAALNP